VFRNCIFCHQPLPTNDALELFPVGKRVAYDAQRGRLWAICPSCGRWTLAPIEERWEALEEIEKRVVDRSHLLAKTDNISLLQTADLEVIRVGQAKLREESWWRYGGELLRRRADSIRVSKRGALINSVLIFMTLGIPIMPRAKLTSRWVRRARDQHFGRYAWRGEAPCIRCGAVLHKMVFHQRFDLLIGTTEGDEIRLVLVCERCGARTDSGHVIEGTTATHVLRRVLAFGNHIGGSEEDVTRATTLIESLDSPSRLMQAVANEQLPIGTLNPLRSLALEIAVNEDTERRLLEMEVRELEKRWKEEELIAGIVDRELT
jgi:hypothetical protein